MHEYVEYLKASDISSFMNNLITNGVACLNSRYT